MATISPPALSPLTKLASLHKSPSNSLYSLSFISSPSSFSLSIASCTKHKRSILFKAQAVTDEEKVVISDDRNDLSKPCELYVCNLPRSCDISELLDLFKPYGTVHSVEVCRDSVTGASRGCGYITMNSIPEARAAIAAIDGSDLGGREIRVKFSADMVPGRKNAEALTSAPKLGIIFESPHKAYIGNLAWSVRPEDLRAHFSQYGTIVSARVLYDRKGGKNRVYGFLSFSTAAELNTAVEASGSDFRGRTLLVREVSKRER